MNIPQRNSTGDIGTTLTRTPSEVSPLQQQNVLQPTTASLPCPKHLPHLLGVLSRDDLWPHAPSSKLRANKGCHQVK